MAGVTPQGFVAKTIEEEKASIEADELSTIDPALNLQPEQPVGQLNAIVSKKLAELWELGAVAYNAFDRDAAEGRLLDNIGALTGTPREPARKSQVTVTLTLGAGFSKAAGEMMANVPGQDAKWTNRDAVTSTSAGTYSAVFESVDYGPIPANAGTLTQITNSLAGWTAITNPLDATLGALEETDTAYRQRQEADLAAPGASTVDAMASDIRDVAGVEQAFVFENTSLVTDGEGLPGKAFEVVIYDGAVPAADDDEVAQAIWDSKPSGAQSYGTSSGTAIDKNGDPQTVYFSRAVVVPIYLEFDVSVDAQKFPAGGATLIKTAATDRGNELALGDDVVALVIASAALSVQGVKDVTSLRLGLAASPVGTANLTIGSRSIAKFDTSRIVVNVT